jgi:hypothetical protein
MEFHFCAGVRPRSFTTSGIKGTMPNQAKKHKKKAREVIQNVLMGTLLKLVRSNLVAFWDTMFFIMEGFKT